MIQKDKSQKVIKKEEKELEVKLYREQKSIKKVNEQPKKQFDIECPSCTQQSWIDFNKSYTCRNCESFIIKQKHQILAKVFEQH